MMTDRQQAILAYIQACHDADELSPTVREIMDALGISSTSVVNYELDALASAGHISRERGSSRGIRLKGETTKAEKLAESLRVMQVQIADLQAEVRRLRQQFILVKKVERKAGKIDAIPDNPSH